MSACCQDCRYYFLGEEEGEWWCKCGEFFLQGNGGEKVAVTCPDFERRADGEAAHRRSAAEKAGARGQMELF